MKIYKVLHIYAWVPKIIDKSNEIKSIGYIVLHGRNPWTAAKQKVSVTTGSPSCPSNMAQNHSHLRNLQPPQHSPSLSLFHHPAFGLPSYWQGLLALTLHEAAADQARPSFLGLTKKKPLCSQKLPCKGPGQACLISSRSKKTAKVS